MSSCDPKPGDLWEDLHDGEIVLVIEIRHDFNDKFRCMVVRPARVQPVRSHFQAKFGTQLSNKHWFLFSRPCE